MLGNEAELLQIRDIKRHLQAIRNYMQQDLQVIVISLPGVGRFTHWCLSPTPMCKTNPQKGKKNYLLYSLLPRQHHCTREIWTPFLDVAWVMGYINITT